ncbi:GAF domain-containing protein [Paenibacillus sp. NRS-1783]|uniref:GAF domain-containing protein n=1 Tax=Paenibacillus sp. NRS-1783 TaxID=3233907 RepID=UPI003D29D09A
MLDELKKPLEEIGKLIISAGKIPWVLPSLGFVIILFVACLGFETLRRIRKGAEFHLFWFYKIIPNQMVENQKDAFDKLNQNALQKSQILKIINNINIEITRMISCEPNEFENNKRSLYNLVLYSVGNILTKSRENSHRVAVFINNGDGFLRISEGFGYSTDGQRNLRLDINNSAAGKVYRTGEPYISGDITSEGNSFRIHPNASKTYFSLMCVPIKCGNMVLGILSLDGSEKDSFNKDDLDYLTYFANTLSSLLFIENMKSEEVNEDEEQQGEPA